MNIKSFQIFLLFFILIFSSRIFGQDFEITSIGNIQASSKSQLGSQVSGRIEKIFVEVGDEVKKGQPLIKIDSTCFEIEANQKNAALEFSKIEMADSEKNYLRMQKLWEKPDGSPPSISQKRFEDAKSKYEQSVVTVKQAQESYNRAKANFDETVISAPYDGIVTKKLVDVGELITATPVTHLLEIQSISPLYLEFSISQAYLGLVQKGNPLQYEIEGSLLKGSEAQIDLFYPCLDENTHSLRCRALIENKDKMIRPGSLVKVTIKGSRP